MKRRILAQPARFAIASGLLSLSAWYIWSYFDWGEVGVLLAQTRLDWFFIGCGALYFAYLLLRTLRWMVMIRNANSRVRFVDLYLPTAILVSVSILTPAQLGEALKVEVLNRRGLLERTAGIGSFLIERMLDMLVLILLAIVSLLATPLLSGLRNYYWVLGGMALVTIIALISLMLINPGGRFGRVLAQLRLTGSSPAALLVPAALTLASWLLVALAWQLALASVGIWVSLLDSVAVMTLTTVGIAVSFIPGGIGVSELIITELLQLFGVDTSHAQAGAIILRVIGLWWVIIGLLHLLYWWLRRPEPGDGAAQ